MSEDNETPIKVIIVKDCLGCPYMEMHPTNDENGADIWCSDKKFVGTMKDICSRKMG
jgi:hypothetical protein